MARRYADENAIPPDSARRPVALRAIAKAIDLPFETVRRRVAALVAEDAVHRGDTGVIVPARVLAENRFRDHNRRTTAHFEHMLGRLVALAEAAR